MNSETRIEIAERMRGPFDVCECMGHTYLSGTLFGMQVCATDEMKLRDGMRRLAGLIDPTCYVIPGRPAFAELEDGTRLTGVSLSCGHIALGCVPRFCCECGARVTKAPMSERDPFRPVGTVGRGGR